MNDKKIAQRDLTGEEQRQRRRLRLWLTVMCVAALGVAWVTVEVLTQRYAATIRNKADVQLVLFSGNLMSELQRNSVVPQLLARDPLLTGALASSDYAQSTQRLIEYREEIGAARLILLDRDGRVVASSDRTDLGSIHRSDPYFVNALRSNTTVFTTQRAEVGLPHFYYSRRIGAPGDVSGVIVVEVDLRKFERSWAGISDAVIVKDSAGEVLLTTEPRWRGRTEEDALAAEPIENAIYRAVQSRVDWMLSPDDVLLNGHVVMRTEARVPFQGWRIVGFTNYNPVWERVLSVVAVEIMIFALMVTLFIYMSSRQTEARSQRLQRESAELKELNALLQREIAERERAEKNLETAEQTLVQSSKLAALGEMSAAVSHELNQPLAAMKTYLAGARLLMQRKRVEEALSSFQRVNDLIDRMAAITRQLKSYASKNTEMLGRVDMRAVISSSVSMMEPQIHQNRIRVTVSDQGGEAPVLGDRFRLEQVIVNLLRNAVDATGSAEHPHIEIVLTQGSRVTVSVRDNGQGIENLDSLFEPFYTTKTPGDGLGLGLAISSGIVSDLGGRLTARNNPEGGAIFELQLPRYGHGDVAA